MFFTAALALLPLLATAAPAPTPPSVHAIERRATGAFISLQRDPSQCLTVIQEQDGVFSNGLIVTTRPCASGSPEIQQWDISPGNGLVRVTGTDYCLDAGVNPSNNGIVKIWQCYPGLFQQQWFLTADQRIAITGGDQCLDQGPTNTQTYQCTSGNTNQAWLVLGGDPPIETGVRIHPNGDTTQCLALASKFAAAVSGTLVDVAPCASISDERLLRWQFTRGDGKVRLADTKFCLDAGLPPQNGALAKIWECYPGNPAQQWFYTNDDRIAITGGDQCLDRRAENPTQAQTWQCTDFNTNQIWTTTA